MKKSVLWGITISAGVISYTAGTILAIMYGKDLYTYTRRKLAKRRKKRNMLFE